MTNITTFPGDCFNLGFVNKKSYTFNPTGNTSKYFIGASYSEGMEIEIDDNGNNHGGTQRFYITRTWGLAPVLSTADVSTAKVYNFYYTQKNDRLYVWFNETLSSSGNNVNYRVRVKTIQAALGPEPAADEQYASHVIGVNNAAAFPAPTIFKRDNQVGIGTNSPANSLHVYKEAAESTSGLLIEKASGGAGTAASLLFGTNAPNENPSVAKAGIIFERTSANGRGDLQFCLDNTDDTNQVALADKRMTIKFDGSTQMHGRVSVNSVNNSAQMNIIGASTDPGGLPTLHVGDAVQDYGDYGMVNLVRHGTAGGSKAHLAFVRSGHSVSAIGFYNNSTNNLAFWAGFGSVTTVPTMILTTAGYIGFGTNDPVSRMHHRQPADQSTSASLGSYQNGLVLQRNATTNRWTLTIDTANSLCFFFDAARKGYLLQGGTDARVNFTGQHRTFIKDVPFTQAEELEGLIVSADNNKYIKMSGGIEAGSNAITVNESLPIVSISTKVKDKKCFGVISASEDPETRQEVHGNFVSDQDKESGDTRVYINSVGEGAIWVSNIGGSLESGDYITTSNVAGYGQRQESDSLKNYTVAKITMDCDFEPVTQPVQIIRKEMGDVNYWVKTTYENVTEEEYSNLADENRRIVTETYFSNEDGEITLEEYNALEPDVQTTYTELTRTIYQKNVYQEFKTEEEGYELKVRQELVNVLDEHGQIQWEDDPSGATEKAYKIRYLDANGVETDEANTVYIAAFVGCTYHCG